MDKRELIERCREHDVKFVRLQFTELYGQLKNISIPAEELEKALDNELMFDGSSIRGFKRIEKSDMYFHPDPDTFQVLPWGERESGQTSRASSATSPIRTARRSRATRACSSRRCSPTPRPRATTMSVGPEAEFFLFKRGEDEPRRRSTRTTRRRTSTSIPTTSARTRAATSRTTLDDLGFHLEASHHEVAIGQHEIDFRHADALTTAPTT